MAEIDTLNWKPQGYNKLIIAKIGWINLNNEPLFDQFFVCIHYQ